MKITDFIDKFTIDPIEDIKPNFKLEKTLDVNTFSVKGCLSCGDQHNQQNLKSVSWTKVDYCWKCETLNVVYVSDRMGGNYTDTVLCYKEKL